MLRPLEQNKTKWQHTTSSQRLAFRPRAFLLPQRKTGNKKFAGQGGSVKMKWRIATTFSATHNNVAYLLAPALYPAPLEMPVKASFKQVLLRSHKPLSPVPLLGRVLRAAVPFQPPSLWADAATTAGQFQHEVACNICVAGFGFRGLVPVSVKEQQSRICKQADRHGAPTTFTRDKFHVMYCCCSMDRMKAYSSKPLG